jgi:exodeoxyribonuclease V alpha subunit
VNGDIGIVVFTGILQDANGDHSQTIIVDWNNGRRVSITGDHIFDLQLAYSTSVHRAQGSGYRCVIISLPNSHRQMLNRRLLNTANSRAKSRVYMVYMQEAMHTALTTDDRMSRHTLLRFMLTSVYT